MPKPWWTSFFNEIIGEVMFGARMKMAPAEVTNILKQTGFQRGNILDLACGVGRHSVVFSRLPGVSVTGLDFSKVYLKQAKLAAEKNKTKVKFVHGDMKHLKPHFSQGEFDLVVSLYNSFGYFDNRSDDIKMLREIHRVLKPGGKLVLNTLNGEGLKKALEKPFSRGFEPMKNVFMIDAAIYDDKKKKTVSNWTIVDARRGKTKISKQQFSQNIYTHKELRKLLRKAGFKIEKTYGLLSGGDFNAKKSWHQTIIAKK